MFTALPFPSELRWPGSVVVLGKKCGLYAVRWAHLCVVSSLKVRNCALDTLLERPQLTAGPSHPLGIVIPEHPLCARHCWRWGRGRASKGLLWAWAPCAQLPHTVASCSLGTLPQVCLCPSWVSQGSPAPLSPAVVLALSAPSPQGLQWLSPPRGCPSSVGWLSSVPLQAEAAKCDGLCPVSGTGTAGRAGLSGLIEP